jgi:mono/diheme cytochrome c family protein
VQLVTLDSLAGLGFTLGVDGGVAADAGGRGAAIEKAAPFDASTKEPGSDGGIPFPIPGACQPRPSGGTDVQATAVAYDGAGQLFAFSREPAGLTVYEAVSTPVPGFATLIQQRTISLSKQSMRDTGHELFHADVGSGLACASCHGEALDDGHVWTFAGFGPRRTQNMRGGLLSTLPLHWEGDMPTFKHLVDDVMTGRMGGFTVEGKYADALATWIDAQPELTLAVKDAAARDRGKALFESTTVACATCHSGPQLTNNKSADVGTGGTFQVPSLMGLGLRGPFMHDGCAKTLGDRFGASCGGGEAHGKTAALSQTQIADLVAYLESL